MQSISSDNSKKGSVGGSAAEVSAPPSDGLFFPDLFATIEIVPLSNENVQTISVFETKNAGSEPGSMYQEWDCGGSELG